MQKKKKQPSVRYRLTKLLDFPSDALGGFSEVTLSESGEISVSRCRHVLEYTPQRICLSLCRTGLTVCGCGLLLHTYFDGHITICGQVDSVVFGEGSV